MKDGDFDYAVELIDKENEPRTVSLGTDIIMDVGASNEGVAAVGLHTDRGRASTLLLVDPSGSATTVDLADRSWSAEWQLWGDVAVDAEGGFLLTRISWLVTISASGAVTESALPKGMIAQYATSDPNRILVGATGNDNGPESRNPAATGLFLFDRHTSTLSREPVVQVPVVAVARSTVGLANVLTSQGAWFRLRPEAAAVMVTEPTDALSWVNAEGTLMAIEATESKTACVGPDDCTVFLVDLSTGRVLQRGPGPVASGVSFLGGSAIYVVGGGSTPLKFVLMDAASVAIRDP